MEIEYIDGLWTKITAIYLAIDKDYAEIFKILLYAGAKLVNSKTDIKETKRILKQMSPENEKVIYEYYEFLRVKD